MFYVLNVVRKCGKKGSEILCLTWYLCPFVYQCRESRLEDEPFRGPVYVHGVYMYVYVCFHCC